MERNSLLSMQKLAGNRATASLVRRRARVPTSGRQKLQPNQRSEQGGVVSRATLNQPEEAISEDGTTPSADDSAVANPVDPSAAPSETEQPGNKDPLPAPRPPPAEQLAGPYREALAQKYSVDTRSGAPASSTGTVAAETDRPSSDALGKATSDESTDLVRSLALAQATLTEDGEPAGESDDERDEVQRLRVGAPEPDAALWNYAGTKLGMSTFVPEALRNDEAADKVDWQALGTFMSTVAQQRPTIDAHHAVLDADLAKIDAERALLAPMLQSAYEAEKGKIEEIVRDDALVQKWLSDMRRDGELISGELDSKGSAAEQISAAAQRAQAASNDGRQKALEWQREENAEKLEDIEADKAAALADVETVSKVIEGVADITADAVVDGPQKAATSFAVKQIKAIPVELYKEWASAEVLKKYNSKIKDTQRNLAVLKSSIGQIKHKTYILQVNAANHDMKAASLAFSAANKKIAAYVKSIRSSRDSLAQYVSQKYAQITVFTLITEASKRMSLVVDTYGSDLQKMRAIIAPLNDSGRWQAALAGYQLALRQRAAKKLKTEEDRIRQALLGGGPTVPGLVWLSQTAAWVADEDQWIASEMDQIATGVHFDFITSIEAKIMAFLPVQ